MKASCTNAFFYYPEGDDNKRKYFKYISFPLPKLIVNIPMTIDLIVLHFFISHYKLNKFFAMQYRKILGYNNFYLNIPTFKFIILY